MYRSVRKIWKSFRKVWLFFFSKADTTGAVGIDERYESACTVSALHKNQCPTKGAVHAIS